MKNYYLPFIPSADVNYLYLLAFYDIAEYQLNTKLYDTIRYSSIRTLAEQVSLSSSTVSRILNSGKYVDFMTIDTERKVIILKNNFRSGRKQPFIMLTAAEVQIIRDKKDNLFAKYLIYLKYYCGYTKNNKNDFPAKQFLSAFGYSTQSNDYLSKISEYNKVLTESKIIKIDKYRDELGHTRNTYAFI